MNTVLLLRFDNIGDFVLWLDTAKEYRCYYPNRKIILAVKSCVVDFARSFDYWDEVINVSELPKLSKKDFSFDTIINCVFSRTFTMDKCVHMLFATHKIASVGDYSNITIEEKKISDTWYTQLIPAKDEPMMELERNAEFLSNLFPECPYDASVPDISHGCQKNPLNIDYMIVFPGASWAGKKWELEKFAHFINRIKRLYSIDVMLCGAQNEYKDCAKIASLCGDKVFNMAGATTLNELVNFIYHAKLLVGNDTSAGHIAPAVQTPSICILGGGHFGRFMPYSDSLQGIKPIAVYEKMNCFNCNWQCSEHGKHTPVPCISAITVDSVFYEASKILHTLQPEQSSKEALQNLYEMDQQNKKKQNKLKRKAYLKQIGSFFFNILKSQNTIRVRICGIQILKFKIQNS